MSNDIVNKLVQREKHKTEKMFHIFGLCTIVCFPILTPIIAVACVRYNIFWPMAVLAVMFVSALFSVAIFFVISERCMQKKLKLA